MSKQTDTCFCSFPAPVYQMSQYYRVGELDDCFGKWSELYDCITYGTKLASDVKSESKPTCMWELKDFKTAQRDWDHVFNREGGEKQ